ncbi:MAG: MFS transporter [Leptospira sp.]|nr:MFS transporter [Leptospira sp.]
MKQLLSSLGLFSLTQTLFQVGTVMLMAVSVLIGQKLASDPENASFPLSFVIFGTLLGLYPAAQFMKWKGRKPGLLLGTFFGFCGALLVSYGIYSKNFFWYTYGHLFFGLHQSFLQYLRFVAMESVSHSQRSTALSWILVAGIPAALFGPLVGLWGKDLVAEHLYLGCFLILGIVLVLQFLVISFLPKPIQRFEEEVSHGTFNQSPRPFAYHFKNLGLWSSILSSAFGFGLMAMLMSAVPVAMKHHGHEMHASTLVLQWHVLGMYIPSFFSGILVKKIGAPQLILAGVIVLSLQVFSALQGTDFLPFAVSLILLGVGWNFMYVGGTNLLVEQYIPAEKNSIQAFHDIFVYSTATLSVYGAGYLEAKIGWHSLNLVSIPFLIFVSFTVIAYMSKVKRS